MADGVIDAPQARLPAIQRPAREQAETAVRCLIAWAGDNPDREGLSDTPARVTRSYAELFSGYDEALVRGAR